MSQTAVSIYEPLRLEMNQRSLFKHFLSAYKFSSIHNLELLILTLQETEYQYRLQVGSHGDRYLEQSKDEEAREEWYLSTVKLTERP